MFRALLRRRVNDPIGNAVRLLLESASWSIDRELPLRPCRCLTVHRYSAKIMAGLRGASKIGGRPGRSDGFVLGPQSCGVAWLARDAGMRRVEAASLRGLMLLPHE